MFGVDSWILAKDNKVGTGWVKLETAPKGQWKITTHEKKNMPLEV